MPRAGISLVASTPTWRRQTNQALQSGDSLDLQNEHVSVRDILTDCNAWQATTRGRVDEPTVCDRSIVVMRRDWRHPPWQRDALARIWKIEVDAIAIVD